MGERPLRILTAVAACNHTTPRCLPSTGRSLPAAGRWRSVYLGFNMPSGQIAAAALQEGADAVAVSSYNGGHLQFFPHLAARLGELGMGRRSCSVEAGDDPAGGCRCHREGRYGADLRPQLATGRHRGGYLRADRGRKGRRVRIPPAVGRGAAACGCLLPPSPLPQRVPARSRIIWRSGWRAATTARFPSWWCPATGAAEHHHRRAGAALPERFPERRIAILANDPTVATSGFPTAFLADRVRMNHIYDDRVWLRSIATATPYAQLSPALPLLVRIVRAAGFDMTSWRLRDRPGGPTRRCSEPIFFSPS